MGYMTLWDVSLDSISMINLIMCIGFSVDFSAHISYAYLAAKVDTPAERVDECLYALGMPILQGGLSTILGILTLILAPSYIFITFFKTVFLVIFFGAMHGIFLLPVLLSLLGPGSCKKYKPKIDDAPAPHPLYKESMTLPPGPLPPIGHYGRAMMDDGLRIPRPHSLNNSQNSTLKFHNSYLANGASNKESKFNMDKDLGLGTSGEDSSESSLGKGAPIGKSSTMEVIPNRRVADRAVPILEVYSNNGYISDDLEAEERRAQERRSRYGEYDNLRMYRHSEYGARRQTRQPRPQYSSARTRDQMIYSENPATRHSSADSRGQRRSRR